MHNTGIYKAHSRIWLKAGNGDKIKLTYRKEKNAQMSNEIIIAVISFVGTVIGSFSGMKLTAYRIEQLESKVEKLNTYAERIPILDEQMKVVNHRLSDLESKS